MDQSTMFRSSRSLRSLQADVNHLFDDLFPTREGNGMPGGRTATWTPKMDVFETENTYRLRVDLPGVDREEVSINVEGRRLMIRGERMKQEQSQDMLRTERNHGRFYRGIALPTEVDPDETKAHMEAGVLTVDLPKVARSVAKSVAIT